MTRAALALFLGGCTLGAAEVPTPAPSLRVATYNLNYGLAGDPETLEAIAATDADVLVLQEVSGAWARSLRGLRDRGWGHGCQVASPWPAGGAAIFARYPVRECAVSDSPIGWFPALAGTVHGPLGPIRVVDLHLQPARGGVAVLDDLARLPAAHEREIAHHLARLIDPALPTVLAGDFNEDDDGGALRELASRGYRSALAEADPHAVTWRWPVGAMHVEKRLDHVLFSSALECVDARVLRAGRSDHRPVVTELARRRPPRALLGASLLAGRGSALTPRR